MGTFNYIGGTIGIHADNTNGIIDNGELAQKLCDLIVREAPLAWGISHVEIDFDESSEAK